MGSIDQQRAVACWALHDCVVEGIFAGEHCLLAKLKKTNGAHDVPAVEKHWVVNLVVAVATYVHGQFFIISFE